MLAGQAWRAAINCVIYRGKLVKIVEFGCAGCAICGMSDDVIMRNSVHNCSHYMLSRLALTLRDETTQAGMLGGRRYM